MFFDVVNPEKTGEVMGFQPGRVFGLYPAAISADQLLRTIGMAMQIQTDPSVTPDSAVASIILRITKLGLLDETSGPVEWFDRPVVHAGRPHAGFFEGTLSGFEPRLAEMPTQLVPEVAVKGYVSFTDTAGLPGRFAAKLFLQPTATPATSYFTFLHLAALA